MRLSNRDQKAIIGGLAGFDERPEVFASSTMQVPDWTPLPKDSSRKRVGVPSSGRDPG